jgi:hypothetical protein
MGGSAVLIVALVSTISWGNPVTMTTNQLQVEKGSSPTGQFVGIAQLPANSTSYTDANNVAGTTACYRVAYLMGNGIGPYAGPVCKTFPKKHGNPHR